MAKTQRGGSAASQRTGNSLPPLRVKAMTFPDWLPVRALERLVHMKRDTFTNVLATAGTVMAWIPLLAPFVFSGLLYGRSHMWRVDYLMPAELSPVALAGAGLLLWAALRAHSRVRLFVWSLAVGIGLLVGSQAMAVMTGLASGATEPVGWRWAVVLAMLAGYVVMLLAVAVGGLTLLRDLFSARGTEKTI